MENHPIPQDITGFQFKLFGNITIRQFAYLAVGAVLAFIFFFILNLPTIIKWPLSFICFGVGAAFAFIPIDGRPLDTMLSHFIKALVSPTRYIYQKTGGKLPNQANSQDQQLITHAQQIINTPIVSQPEPIISAPASFPQSNNQFQPNLNSTDNTPVITANPPAFQAPIAPSTPEVIPMAPAPIQSPNPSPTTPLPSPEPVPVPVMPLPIPTPIPTPPPMPMPMPEPLPLPETPVPVTTYHYAPAPAQDSPHTSSAFKSVPPHHSVIDEIKDAFKHKDNPHDSKELKEIKNEEKALKQEIEEIKEALEAKDKIQADTQTSEEVKKMQDEINLLKKQLEDAQRAKAKEVATEEVKKENTEVVKDQVSVASTPQTQAPPPIMLNFTPATPPPAISITEEVENSKEDNKKAKEFIETQEKNEKLESELEILKKQLKDTEQAKEEAKNQPAPLPVPVQEPKPNEEALSKQLAESNRQREELEKQLAVAKTKMNQTQEQTFNPTVARPVVNLTKHVRSVPQDMGKIVGLPSIPENPNLITGIVKDPRGNPIPNILVEVKDQDSNPVRAFKTNGLGKFASATSLSNGKYLISFEDSAEKNKFDAIELELIGDIVMPLEIISVDPREELRRELFN